MQNYNSDINLSNLIKSYETDTIYSYMNFSDYVLKYTEDNLSYTYPKFDKCISKNFYKYHLPSFGYYSIPFEELNIPSELKCYIDGLNSLIYSRIDAEDVNFSHSYDDNTNKKLFLYDENDIRKYKFPCENSSFLINVDELQKNSKNINSFFALSYFKNSITSSFDSDATYSEDFLKYNIWYTEEELYPFILKVNSIINSSPKEYHSLLVNYVVSINPFFYLLQKNKTLESSSYAVNSFWFLIKFVPKNLLDENLAFLAINNNPYSFEFIPDFLFTERFIWFLMKRVFENDTFYLSNHCDYSSSFKNFQEVIVHSLLKMESFSEKILYNYLFLSLYLKMNSMRLEYIDLSFTDEFVTGNPSDFIKKFSLNLFDSSDMEFSLEEKIYNFIKTSSSDLLKDYISLDSSFIIWIKDFDDYQLKMNIKKNWENIKFIPQEKLSKELIELSLNQNWYNLQF